MKIKLNEESLRAYIREAIRQEINEDKKSAVKRLLKRLGPHMGQSLRNWGRTLTGKIDDYTRLRPGQPKKVKYNNFEGNKKKIKTDDLFNKEYKDYLGTYQKGTGEVSPADFKNIAQKGAEGDDLKLGVTGWGTQKGRPGEAMTKKRLETELGNIQTQRKNLEAELGELLPSTEKGQINPDRVDKLNAQIEWLKALETKYNNSIKSFNRITGVNRVATLGGVGGLAYGVGHGIGRRSGFEKGMSAQSERIAASQNSPEESEIQAVQKKEKQIQKPAARADSAKTTPPADTSRTSQGNPLKNFRK